MSIVSFNYYGSSPTFIHFTEKEGLPNDAIYGILSDDKVKHHLSPSNPISVTEVNEEK